jgi:hypothetical protein
MAMGKRKASGQLGAVRSLPELSDGMTRLWKCLTANKKSVIFCKKKRLSFRRSLPFFVKENGTEPKRKGNGN